MIRLKLKIVENEGQRSLKRNTLAIRYLGDPSELNGGAPGEEFDFECAYAGNDLVALALLAGNAPPLARRLDERLTSGDVDGVLAQLEALRALAVKFHPKLHGVYVRALLPRGNSEASASAFRALLASMEKDWGDAREALRAFEAFDNELRARLASDFASWIEQRKHALPIDMKLPASLPRAGHSSEALLKSAADSLAGLSASPGGPPWARQPEFEASMKELDRRSLPAAAAAEHRRLVDEHAAKSGGFRERTRRQELGEFRPARTSRSSKRSSRSNCRRRCVRSGTERSTPTRYPVTWRQGRASSTCDGAGRVP